MVRLHLCTPGYGSIGKCTYISKVEETEGARSLDLGGTSVC